MMQKPDTLPDAVVASLQRWSTFNGRPSYDTVVAMLRWDCLMGCYYFVWAGMFVGVESDGHIHT